MTGGDDRLRHNIEKIRGFSFGTMPPRGTQRGKNGLYRHSRPVDDVPPSAIKRMGCCFSRCQR
jgi:hypothetical protein